MIVTCNDIHYPGPAGFLIIPVQKFLILNSNGSICHTSLLSDNDVFALAYRKVFGLVIVQANHEGQRADPTDKHKHHDDPLYSAPFKVEVIGGHAYCREPILPQRPNK